MKLGNQQINNGWLDFQGIYIYIYNIYISLIYHITIVYDINHLSVVSSSLVLGPKGRRSGPRPEAMRVYQLTHLFSQPPKYKASKSQHQMQFGEKFSDVQTFGFGKLEDDPGSQRL